MGRKVHTYLSYWVTGVLVALFGVALVRLIAPATAMGGGKIYAVIGYILSLCGMGIIIYGIRKRHNVTAEREEEVREHP